MSLEIRCLVADGITANARSRPSAIEFELVGPLTWNPTFQDYRGDYGQFG